MFALLFKKPFNKKERALPALFFYLQQPQPLPAEHVQITQLQSGLPHEQI
jgi:hypothetical protein